MKCWRKIRFGIEKCTFFACGRLKLTFLKRIWWKSMPKGACWDKNILGSVKINKNTLVGDAAEGSGPSCYRWDFRVDRRRWCQGIPTSPLWSSIPILVGTFAFFVSNPLFQSTSIHFFSCRTQSGFQSEPRLWNFNMSDLLSSSFFFLLQVEAKRRIFRCARNAPTTFRGPLDMLSSTLKPAASRIWAMKKS